MNICLLLSLYCSIQVQSQVYLNIDRAVGADRYAEVDKIVEITFNETGDQMMIDYSDGKSIHTFDLNDDFEMSFSDTPIDPGDPIPVELMSFSVE